MAGQPREASSSPPTPILYQPRWGKWSQSARWLAHEATGPSAAPARALPSRGGEARARLDLPGAVPLSRLPQASPKAPGRGGNFARSAQLRAGFQAHGKSEAAPSHTAAPTPSPRTRRGSASCSGAMARGLRSPLGQPRALPLPSQGLGREDVRAQPRAWARAGANTAREKVRFARRKGEGRQQ